MKIFVATYVTVNDYDDLHDTLRDALRNDDLEILATFPQFVTTLRDDAIDRARDAMIDDYIDAADPDSDPPPSSIIQLPHDAPDNTDVTIFFNLLGKRYACIVVRVHEL